MSDVKKRPRQGITMKKRYGPDIFAVLGAKSKGGGFNNREIASLAGKKGRQKQLEQKRLREQQENESRSSTHPETSDATPADYDS